MATYIRLTDYKSSEEKEKGFFEEKNRYVAKQEDFFKIPGSPIAYWVSSKVREIFSESLELSNYLTPRRGFDTNDNEKYLRYWFEINFSIINNMWYKSNIGGDYRKWEGNNLFVINHSIIFSASLNLQKVFFKPGITWTSLSSSHFGVRYFDKGYVYNNKSAFKIENENMLYFLSFLSSKIAFKFLKIINPTMNFQAGNVADLPIIFPKTEQIKQKIDQLTQECIDISKEEWDSRETSWDFKINELIRILNDEYLMLNEKEDNSKFKIQNLTLETIYNHYCNYWREKFYKLHKNEEELNRLFIEIYGLEDELTPDVELKDITILKKETKIENNELVFDKKEIIKQFISYAVGVMFGRYSLDHKGLHIADTNESLEEANLKFNIKNPTFEADDDNIIPVLEDEYFSDDIVSRFVEFIKVVFGKEHLSENIRFMENALGKDLRKYFVKDFYKDHIQRYKKRPIYWMISSPKKGFMALIYMHRYKPDIFARIQRLYLHEYISKLESAKANAEDIENSDIYSQKDRIRATQRIKRIESLIEELVAFDRDRLDHFAKQNIIIDLDDGVKVNYCKFKDILYPISGLCKK